MGEVSCLLKLLSRFLLTVVAVSARQCLPVDGGLLNSSRFKSMDALLTSFVKFFDIFPRKALQKNSRWYWCCKQLMSNMSVICYCEAWLKLCYSTTFTTSTCLAVIVPKKWRSSKFWSPFQGVYPAVNNYHGIAKGKWWKQEGKSWSHIYSTLFRVLWLLSSHWPRVKVYF